MGDGWDQARAAAWTAFGFRWWRWIVAAAVVRRVLPVVVVLAALGGLVAGAWYGWQWVSHLHGPTLSPDWGWWLGAGIGAAVVLALLVALVRAVRPGGRLRLRWLRLRAPRM